MHSLFMTRPTRKPGNPATRLLHLLALLSTALLPWAGCAESGRGTGASQARAGHQAVQGEPDPAGRPRMEVHADGTATMAGRGYAAGFSNAGLRFVLEASSDAVSVAMSRVEYAGQPLASRSDAVVVQSRPDEAVVDYVHGDGAVVERYLGVAEGVEQSFVLPGLPAGSGEGDLVIRCSLATDLETGATLDDWSFEPIVFAGASGQVTLGTVIARDADGRSTRLPLRLERGGYSIRVHGDWLAQASFPVDVDPMLGASARVSSSLYDEIHSDIAWNRNDDQGLVVWEQQRTSADRDIWAALTDAKGARLAAPFQVDTSSTRDARWPSVAWHLNNGQYLVAWQEARSVVVNGATSFLWDVKARVIENSGTPAGAPFTVATSAGHNLGPDVGSDFSSPNWLVVFEREFSSANRDIRGQLVSTTGPVGNIILVTTAPYKQTLPSVNQMGYGQWLVAWQDQRGGLTAQLDIWAREIKSDGSLPSVEYRVHAASGLNERWPAVAGAVASFMVAFTQETQAGGFDIKAVFTDPAVRAPLVPVDIQSGPHDTRNVNAAFYLGQVNILTLDYLVTWSDKRSGNWDIYGERWDIQGQRVEDDFPIATHASDQDYARVAPRDGASEASYVVVYESKETGASQVYAQRAGTQTSAPTITSGGLAPAGLNQYYTSGINGQGGSSPYAWTVSAGTLPPGLFLDTSVALTTTLDGTPTTTGNYSFTVRLTDSLGRFAEEAYTLDVLAGPTVTTTTLPNPTLGASYSAAISAQSGAAPYYWTLSAGSLPPGLQLASSTTATETLSGTPTQAGTYDFTLEVYDNNGLFDDQDFTVVVSSVAGPVITTTSLPVGMVNTAYNQPITAQQTAQRAPYAWTLQSGSLPAGLTLNLSGNFGTTLTLSGMPTAAGTSSFTVRITDSGGLFDDQDYQLSIAPGAAPVITTGTPLPGSSRNTAYQTTITATQAPSASPYTWTLAAGALPPGVNLVASTGLTVDLSGTPTQAGTYSFTLKVQDNYGQSAQQAYTLDVTSGPAFSTTSPLKPAYVGQPYPHAIRWTGGTAPYSIALTGTLPTGLTLAATSSIAGTSVALTGFVAQAAGPTSFTLQVTDAASLVSPAQAFALEVLDPPQVLAGSLPPADQGQVYSATITATGGAAPYAWSLSNGGLPAGLNLDTTSVGLTTTIAGTPSGIPAAYFFTLRVTDANGMAADASFFVNLQGTMSVTTTGLPDGLTGFPYAANLDVAGGTGPYTWSLAGGALHAGLTLDAAAGKVAGVPQAAGGATLYFQVADSTTPTPNTAFGVLDLTVHPSVGARKKRNSPLGCSAGGEGGTGTEGLPQFLLLAGVVAACLRRRRVARSERE